MTNPIREQLQTTLGAAYILERELGGGGMSRVFVAEETALHRKVVVKLLSPELAQGLSVERFEREIQTAAALQQANIVPVLASGSSSGLPYYTMPFVEGESLRQRLGRGPLAIPEVIGVLRDVAKALAYAHQRGVVHRDIKPDNVLLSGGTAVVTDFGIAKAISASRTESHGATLTQLGTSIGTPAYMAPEQAAGDAGVDQRADIYSLGAMAYELLTGQVIFANRTPQRMLAAHMAETPRPVTELRPDTPAPLADLVMRCLSKEARQRPQSAAEVAQALETTSGGSMAAMPPILLGGPGMLRKALAIYAAAFVVVAVVAKAAIVGIGLPDWVFPGALIVMALGLPVILWTGYVQRVARRAATATPTFTPGGTPAVVHGTIATMALKAAPRVSWYRTARGGMYALAAFVLVIGAAMAMRSFGFGPLATLRARGQLSARDQVLLTDFRTTNTDSTLGRVVSDAVRAGLSGSSAFTLVQPNAVVASLQRMRLAPATKVDSAVARQIALREGIKAIVDGEVTGVAGGYIVALRLVRADSGIELASFRETGDGPRGLIDASDKLARALRSKAGESLRAVNATPALVQATTSSLEALREYGEASRANAQGLGDEARAHARKAVALDSTFAAGWSQLAIQLSNWGGTQSAIDSAQQQAYRYKDRVGDRERERIIANYYSRGPGRDRDKAAAAEEAMMRAGDTSIAAVWLGEELRSKREFARTEALNLMAARANPGSGTPLGNAIEMQLNQSKLREAGETLRRLKSVAPEYGMIRELTVLYAQGDTAGVRRIADSVVQSNPQAMRGIVTAMTRNRKLQSGRLRDVGFGAPIAPRTGVRVGPAQSFYSAWLEFQVLGTSRTTVARLDSAIALVPFREMPLVDRPYLDVASALAQAGSVDRAKAMLSRYRNEMTDTSLVRLNDYKLHNALAEIAIAEKKPLEAVSEFRRGDVAYDGAPANECAPCLPFNLARAYDAAAMTDSAIVMYEKYLSTPFWGKYNPMLDGVRVPAIHERLGQLYEAKGDAAKAAEHYRTFIALWGNADPELQPRVAAARERLRKVAPMEKAR